MMWDLDWEGSVIVSTWVLGVGWLVFTTFFMDRRRSPNVDESDEDDE